MTAAVTKTATSSVTAKEVWDAVEAGKPVFARVTDNGEVRAMCPADVGIITDNNARVVYVSCRLYDNTTTTPIFALYPDGTFSETYPSIDTGEAN